MVRLTDEQWERIRKHFLDTFPMVALVENLFQHVERLKRPCGFSTRVRNGTCCHKTTR